MFLALRCANHAHAQPGFSIQVKLQCNTTKHIVDMLAKKYREVPTGSGTSMGEQIRLFESHDAGNKQTWTIVVTNPNGFSCLIRGGDDWVTNPIIPKGDPT